MKRELRDLVAAIGLIGLYVVMVYWMPLFRRRLFLILMVITALLVTWAVERDAGGFSETMSTKLIPATMVLHRVFADDASASSNSIKPARDEFHHYWLYHDAK